jgi:hypothetical protein
LPHSLGRETPIVAVGGHGRQVARVAGVALGGTLRGCWPKRSEATTDGRGLGLVRHKASVEVVQKWARAEVGHSHQAADVLDGLLGLDLVVFGLIVFGSIVFGSPLLVSPALHFVALGFASALGGLKL